MRRYRTESMFELALRLTQQIKESEHFIMREQRNGDVYLESITLLNLIHETLDEPESTDAYLNFRVENLKPSTQQGSPIDHYTFNGERYEVDWDSLADDDYREFGG